MRAFSHVSMPACKNNRARPAAINTKTLDIRGWVQATAQAHEVSDSGIA